MKHVFWLEENSVAGRSGPNKDEWELEELREGGIGAVISVNDGALCQSEEFSDLGMAYTRVSLAENIPPRPGDLELCTARLPAAYDFLAERLDAGEKILIHCRSGRDRTCLLMAYYLCRRYALGPVEAMERVKAVRAIAFSSEGWDAFALKVLRDCEANGNSTSPG